MARRLGLEFLFTVLLLPQAAAAQSLGIFSWPAGPVLQRGLRRGDAVRQRVSPHGRGRPVWHRAGYGRRRGVSATPMAPSDSVC